MTETLNPDRLTVPHPTWSITAYRKGATWKVIAISPNRKHVLHKEKLTDEGVAAFDPEVVWGGGAAPKMVDFVAAGLGAK